VIDVRTDAGVAWATIDNPPLNLLTLELFGHLARLIATVDADPEVRVLVLQSANPEFFIAHFDVTAILSFPHDGKAERAAEPNGFVAMGNRFAESDTVTIAKIAGRVGGGGSELAMAFDLRYAAVGRPSPTGCSTSRGSSSSSCVSPSHAWRWRSSWPAAARPSPASARWRS
jgi:enoyl-CoA hydratase/carnithine racemase